jgi:hypothetical protein
MPSPGKRHPLYRAIKIAWWVLAIWLSLSVLLGVIRGTFVTGPVPPEAESPAVQTGEGGEPPPPKRSP